MRGRRPWGGCRRCRPAGLAFSWPSLFLIRLSLSRSSIPSTSFPRQSQCFNSLQHLWYDRMRMKKRTRQLGNVAALLAAPEGSEAAPVDATDRKRYLVAALCKAFNNSKGIPQRMDRECADLSPRKKQTLALLLRGDSE